MRPHLAWGLKNRPTTHIRTRHTHLTTTSAGRLYYTRSTGTTERDGAGYGARRAHASCPRVRAGQRRARRCDATRCAGCRRRCGAPPEALSSALRAVAAISSRAAQSVPATSCAASARISRWMACARRTGDGQRASRWRAGVGGSRRAWALGADGQGRARTFDVAELRGVDQHVDGELRVLVEPRLDLHLSPAPTVAESHIMARRRHGAGMRARGGARTRGGRRRDDGHGPRPALAIAQHGRPQRRLYCGRSTESSFLGQASRTAQSLVVLGHVPVAS